MRAAWRPSTWPPGITGFRCSTAPMRRRSSTGAVEQVDLAGADRNVSVELKYAKPGTILIKEIYSGGCPQDPPATGSYADDKYIVLHNNSFDTYYLDGLCLGMVAPYNSNANNPWTSTDSSGNIVFRDYAAMPDCIWMFPGTGTDFPLEPAKRPSWPITAWITRRPTPSR